MEQTTRAINNPRMKFILLYIVSVAIISLIVSALSAPKPMAASVSIVEQNITAPVRRMEEVSKREKEMAQELEAKTSSIARLQEQLAATSQVNGETVDKTASLKTQVAEQQQKIARLEQQLSDKTLPPANNTGRKTAKLESDNKYLSLALTSQARQTKSLTEEVKMLRAEVEKLRKK